MVLASNYLRSDSSSCLPKPWSSISISICWAIAAVTSRLAPASVRASSSSSCTVASEVEVFSFHLELSRSTLRFLSSESLSSTLVWTAISSSTLFLSAMRSLSTEIVELGVLLGGIAGNFVELFLHFGDSSMTSKVLREVPKSSSDPVSWKQERWCWPLERSYLVVK